ncbi:MAG: fluoride efflux transporter CrcB [Sedimentisphaerales bacterium]|nr:fluoride efflux transporter CrcB [Sedimentisphaerales bacterium]
MILKVLLIALGGAIGSVCRYGLGGLVYRLFGSVFPWGTAAVNIVGSLIIGFLWAMFERAAIGPNMRMFVFIGILGGFTTFSSYTLETFNLLHAGETRLAITNMFVSNIVGVAAVFIGFAIFRYMVK